MNRVTFVVGAVVSGDGPAVQTRRLFSDAQRALGVLWAHTRQHGDTELCSRVEAAMNKLVLLSEDEPITGKTRPGIK